MNQLHYDSSASCAAGCAAERARDELGSRGEPGTLCVPRAGLARKFGPRTPSSTRAEISGVRFRYGARSFWHRTFLLGKERRLGAVGGQRNALSPKFPA